MSYISKYCHYRRDEFGANSQTSRMSKETISKISLVYSVVQRIQMKKKLK